ncbi:MAG: hypothetical protein AB1515_02915 [Nitrospirota bacterium]
MTPSSRSRRQAQAGGVKLGTLVFLLLIAGGIYLAFAYIPPWMAYRALKDQMIEQTRESAILPDEEIRERLAIIARSWELPLTAEDFVVTRTDGRLSIAAQWDVTIHHFGLYDHRLRFAPTSEEMVLPGRP